MYHPRPAEDGLSRGCRADAEGRRTMVAAIPAGELRRQVEGFFQSEPPPESLAWVSDLSALHLRQFVVELSDALKRAIMHRDDTELLEVIDEWRATADLDAAPDVQAAVRRAKDFRPLSAFTA